MSYTSKFIDRFYLGIVVSLILSAILPLFYYKTFNSDGKELTSELESLVLFDAWAIYILVFYVLFIALLFISHNTIKHNRIRKIRYISWIPQRLILLFPLSILVYIIFYIDVQVRMPFLFRAFGDQVVFGNVVQPSFGYYFLLLTFILTLSLFFLNHKKESEEVVLYFQTLPSRSKGLLKNPIVIQYLTFHFSILLFMMITYSVHFDDPAFWKGVTYYTKLFYLYGLNGRINGSEIALIYFIEGWIIMPIVITTISMFFYFSYGAGFAPNGAPIEDAAPENAYATSESINFFEWGFFSHDVPLADHWFGDPKNNGFYISLFCTVLVSLILGAIISRYFGKKLKYDGIYLMLAGAALAIWRFAYNFASLSAPVITLWGGIVESTFFERGYNRFIIYRYAQANLADAGYYHPMTTFWILFLYAIPLVAIARYLIFLSFRKVKTKEDIMKIEREKTIANLN